MIEVEGLRKRYRKTTAVDGSAFAFGRADHRLRPPRGGDLRARRLLGAAICALAFLVLGGVLLARRDV